MKTPFTRARSPLGAIRARSTMLVPAYYAAALACFLTLYYVGHAALYSGLSAIPVI